VSEYVSRNWGTYTDDCTGSGTLLPGVIARVIRKDGALGDYDEPGELLLYSPSKAMCYLNNAGA